MKVKCELKLIVEDELPPEYIEEMEWKDGCDCIMDQLHAWIKHQKKLFQTYIDKDFKDKYGEES